MQGNIFAGLNENMASIMARTTATGFTPSNLFAEILKDKNQVSQYFKEQGEIKNMILDFEERKETETADEGYTDRLQRTLNKVITSSPDRFVNEVVFLNIIARDNKLNKVLLNVVSKYCNPEYVLEDFEKMISPKPNMVWAKRDETILDVLGRNLTQLSKDGELQEIVDREEETQRLIQILTRTTKSNPAIVGEAGVGKTALVEKLAFVLNDHASIPSSLHNHKLYEISVSAIIASGDVEGAIAEIVKITSVEKIIVFIDEVHLIMANKGQIANLLKPAMARGDIKLIGATTEDEYKAFEKDKAMTRRFQPVKLNVPTKVSVYRILKAKAHEAEEQHNVLIPDASLLKAIQLSERYMPSRQQPDKAIDLVEEASAKLRMILESKPEVIIEIDREVSDLEIEIEMIYTAARDPESISSMDKKKIQKFDEELVEKRKEQTRLNEAYTEQRKLLQAMIETKALLSTLKQDLDKALHLGNFSESASLKTKVIPDIQKQLKVDEQAVLKFAETTDENLIQNVVTPVMIARIIEDQTGIPVMAQDEDDLEKYKNIEVTLKETVKGQDKPIQEISAAIKRSKAGLADGNKPLGSFLCLGPTGVGKTFLAQELAKFMFDTDKVLHRFDMSEYMEAHSVARLFGSPPGYVGHDEGGQLTEEIKRNPYSIILFDEIEKAHPRVFDTLLQVLDAGRMTDGQGNVIDFKNTIIVMTSNIGSAIIRQGLEQGLPSEAIEIALFEEVRKHFRPEFLNRFDAKVMFNSLAPDSIHDIAVNELNKLAERLHQENSLEMHWHVDLPILVTNRAYDVNDGARPIKRYINDIIINELTKLILASEVKPGDTIYVAPSDVGGSDIVVLQIPSEDMKIIKEEETSEMSLLGSLVKDTVATDPYKIHDDQIVDADVDKKKSKSKKKKKTEAKVEAKDALAKTFSLKTEVGD